MTTKQQVARERRALSFVVGALAVLVACVALLHLAVRAWDSEHIQQMKNDAPRIERLRATQ